MGRYVNTSFYYKLCDASLLPLKHVYDACLFDNYTDFVKKEEPEELLNGIYLLLSFCKRSINKVLNLKMEAMLKYKNG